MIYMGLNQSATGLQNKNRFPEKMKFFLKPAALTSACISLPAISHSRLQHQLKPEFVPCRSALEIPDLLAPTIVGLSLSLSLSLFYLISISRERLIYIDIC